ncbi:hypothetical protein SAICODRAFT_28683 [Saitoella complicata NRRL Y-17804]|uniref:Uncharacterized protein n=1 Tax=Saitoella complicata (strain BCRC 22490 / CBS 7301 / JCM 7358 / NBRC 10748 / NRRL Y-17804) TaxID=698492 RepID=A0A0E9NSD6_SAICN|nr:uncharacterized protein SAICODRAFT_28683 [Saitoella complicata NRRL Y-17804]ODQ56619.1 hypothetical protein SAICODRAFT_28683 [Saitoella complicata NRRL Y-17804]GAO52683.1 hypothetical protein G7K_6754-t1 [Saitoella complicata NRRL Y-17804]
MSTYVTHLFLRDCIIKNHTHSPIQVTAHFAHETSPSTLVVHSGKETGHLNAILDNINVITGEYEGDWLPMTDAIIRHGGSVTIAGTQPEDKLVARFKDEKGWDSRVLFTLDYEKLCCHGVQVRECKACFEVYKASKPSGRFHIRGRRFDLKKQKT